MPDRPFVENDVRQLDAERAPGGHGIARVHCEIEDDLFNLPGVGFDFASRGLKEGAQFDIFADQAPQHFVHAGNNLI